MALVVVPSLTLDQLELDALDWLCVAYACFISSALNYYLYAWANARSSPAFIMAFAPIQNIVTPILAFFLPNRKSMMLALCRCLGTSLAAGACRQGTTKIVD